MTLKKDQYIWGLLRISMGWIFLWAFLDKTFGLGFSTTSDKAWIMGSSPTSGFLQFATKGPFIKIFQSMSGSTIVDWLFMLGLLVAGISLLLGIGVKIGGYTAFVLLVLMYLAGFIPPEHNPIIDEHIIYALIALGFTKIRCGEWIGLGSQWAKTKLVKKYPAFK